MKEIITAAVSLLVGIPILFASSLILKAMSIPFMVRTQSIRAGQTVTQINEAMRPFDRREQLRDQHGSCLIWYAGLAVSYKDARVQVDFDESGIAKRVVRIWPKRF